MPESEACYGETENVISVTNGTERTVNECMINNVNHDNVSNSNDSDQLIEDKNSSSKMTASGKNGKVEKTLTTQVFYT